MTDFLEMDDEEFLNLTSPPESELEEEETDTSTDEESESEAPVTEEEDKNTEVEEEDEKTVEESEESSQEDENKSTDETVVTEDSSEVENSTDVEKTQEVDYKAFYEQIMAPFKANGKTIELKSPDEALRLMQMGANYTRKMQDIAPYRKVLMMLENHGLLDETKLSYLIDLDKKNPEAIKKLVKDTGIDPLDLNPEEEPAYTVGNHHAVTDQEAEFRSVVDDLVSTPTGYETVKVISEWDQASKNKLWNEPAAMVALNQQRELGIYDLIATEVERQKALGTIPVSTPFLDAYTQVGDMMRQAGAFNKPQPAAPIATKVGTPKNTVSNSDKAKAAALSKSTTKEAKPLVNPLALPDDDFLKQMANRL